MNSADNSSSAWPALAYADWQDSCNTLHLWTQIVGKVKLALAPLSNHWWGVVLFVTARGLTTGAVPYGSRAHRWCTARPREHRNRSRSAARGRDRASRRS